LPGDTVVVSQATVYGPTVTSAPKGAPSTKNCTPATLTLSDTVVTTETRPKTVDPEAGAVIATDGGEPGGTDGGGEPGGRDGGGEPGGTDGEGEPGGTDGEGEPGGTDGELTVTKLILVMLLLPSAPLTVRLTV